MRSNRLAPLYRAFLGLYPPAFREEHGAEMAEVFEEASADAAARGRRHLLKLCALEAAGLAAGAAREWRQPGILAAEWRANAVPVAAGAAAGGAFLLGAVFAGGPWIFQPAFCALAAGLLILGSIVAGRIWASKGTLAGRLLRTGGALLLVLAAVPAARLADTLWLGSLAASGGEVAYSLPGINVEARSVAVALGTSLDWEAILPSDRRGLIHSGSLRGAGETRLVTIWHRLPSSPPYELLIPLLAGLFSVASHAARRRKTAPAAD